MTLEKNYYQQMNSQGLVVDHAQLALIRQLTSLVEELQKSLPGRLWAWRKPKKIIKGLYIYGQVGRGKTMLMDLFYHTLSREDKLRVHFNKFMQDVQEKLENERQKITAGKVKYHDPIPPVAAVLAARAKILCFDEFSVTDIADAMILSRLFTQLFAHGVVLVATSNVPPDELYKNGLNRALFLPFIQVLKQHVSLFTLDGAVDYRMEKLIDKPFYLTPLGSKTTQKMDEAFACAVGTTTPTPQMIEARGRRIEIPQAAGKIARFDFDDLCTKPLGSHDYALLTQKYRCFFIDNVPIFNNMMRNEAKRFILAIDTLYEARAKIFISAAAPPDKLYQSSIQTTESFEFQRTASRLYEMQSADYLNRFPS